MDVNARLEATGLPFAYRKFKAYKNKPLPSPPYIVWFTDNERHTGGDFKNFIKHQHITLELYSKKKDTKSETKIENAFFDVELDKWEDYIESQELYMVSYEFDTTTKIGGI